MGLFTLAEAREVLGELRPVLDEVVRVRADAADLGLALQLGTSSRLGGRAEYKGLQARLDEALTTVQQTGVMLRGFAPLLLDFEGDVEGVPALLCWLEGEPDIRWYHRADLGFAGRRPLPD